MKAPTTAGQHWAYVADEAQQDLTDHFQSRVFGARLLYNTSPLRLGQLGTFNYWWLAHAVEVRVDGAERRGAGKPDAVEPGAEPGVVEPGAAARAELAENTFAGIRCRNRGRLVNHYFDDMGWLALAAVRLFDLTGSPRHLDDARELWQFIATHGGSTLPGGGIAWRDSQLDYRNAPTNGAFAILSARLATRTGEEPYRTAFDRTLDFMTNTFVSETGEAADLVADGVNRLGDGALDDGWLFTYNQGLYIGALVEAFDVSGDRALLDRATRTAVATIARLAPSGLFLGEPAVLGERGGGDAGLFKGIFFRYLELLLERLDPAAVGFRMLGAFLTSNTDRLSATSHPLANDDWSRQPGRTVALSTQLSAVMALEARARFELWRDRLQGDLP